MRDFRDLEVWQQSHQLTLEVYRVTEAFPASERFGLISQIRRACASIPTNLAEGCGRWGDGDMARFVQIAMGSASELDYQLLLANDLGLLHVEKYQELVSDLNSVRRMLTSFYKKLKEPSIQNQPRALRN
jgi:four helix bundle protein